MRSAGGEHYIGLDHVRAFAAFLVFSWHFLHVNKGNIHPPAGTSDLFVFSFFTQGFTGVSLFMVLSGYLFAKLTHKQPLDLARFYSARALRLLPLLIAVCVLALAIQAWKGDAQKLAALAWRIAQGPLLPTLPNGGWSITVEFHFYLLFPLIVAMERRKRFSSLGLVALALSFRVIHMFSGSETSAHYLAYGTLVGRIDQFIIGMLFAYYGSALGGRHLIALASALGVFVLFWLFQSIGGFHGNTAHPNVWVIMVTLEGLFYGALINWYDRSFTFKDTGLSGIVGKVGAASYSIYLLHFFVVFKVAELINAHIVQLDTFYKTFAAALLCFVPMSAIGWCSYRYFEQFWLRFRRPYIQPLQ